MPNIRWLSVLLVLYALAIDLSVGIRIYKSRRKAMAMLSGVTTDSQQYFGSCKQSTNEEGCRMAIDNDFSPEWSQCATTDPEDSSWWLGHLENPMYVTSVYILNADWLRVGETDGLLEFTISGNGHVCYTHSAKASFESKTFPCDILADDIEIRSSIKGGLLAICEVQVYGAALKFVGLLDRPVPIPFDGCTQTSTDRVSYCWNAIDDNPVQKADKGSCAMTHPGNFQSWTVTLIIPALVQQIVVYNRDDCCQDQLTNFEVRVGGRRCARYNSAKTFSTKPFKCNRFGGDVTIQQMSSAVLTLCEVFVYGFLVEMVPEQKRRYLGCYQDNPADPDIADNSTLRAEPVSLTAMHVNKCDLMCRRVKSKYFGLQAGLACWCGASYGKYGKVADTECQMECEGKRKEACGGLGKNMVFEIL